MVELLGILLTVQGVGGFVNRVAGGESKSWFVQLHVLPESLHIPASIVLALVGGVLAFAGGSRRRKDSPRS
ncbi:hypothetical protein [Prauserella muralis]|uniref:Uncharacterized protein n=2 Tax=Prauserella muralis TaxID=588067 RepID=A0A2V4B324_9PSEU|nr:hypothetical protein [Prauserella muralis]PXY28473.1 hypothetical protein BAY60_17595 [Prauserella muralis]TWE22045.1 putative secreted protein with PEP-CTERM sorting signal [Prauserella muralis]